MARMVLTSGVLVDVNAVHYNIKRIINRVYKLLPMREEGAEWEKPLDTILQQLAGMQRLMEGGFPEIFFPLLNKLQGLYSLITEEEFLCYRRTIFECLGLMNDLKEKLCHQNY